MKYWLKNLTAKGEEILSSTPLAVPLGFKKPQSISDKIAEFVYNQRLQEKLDAAGVETFEDAEDFEIGDDFEALPPSKYEGDFDNLKSKYRKEREDLKRARTFPKEKSSKNEFTEEFVNVEKKQSKKKQNDPDESPAQHDQ